MKLFGFLGNTRTGKVIVTANFCGINLDVEYMTQAQIKNKDFLKKNPLGQLPTLETPQGCLFESNAIMRFLARESKSATLYGTNSYEAGLVDQWLDFCSNELEPSMLVILFQVLGYGPYIEERSTRAKKDLQDKLKILENHLKTSNLLVGKNVTLADIAIVSALTKLFQFVFDDKFRKTIPTITKYIEHCRNLEQFQKVFGKLWLCQKEFPVPESIKQSEPKKVKQEKDKKEQPKEQPKKKEEAKPKATEKPAVEDQDDDAPKPKAKNPLDLLPETKFNFFDFKTLYVNAPNKVEAMNEFFKQWDPQGFSVWFLKYDKYVEGGEGKVLFLTNNLMNGQLQRLDDHFRKYALGIYGVYGEEPDLEIRGCWIFRGTDVPQEFKDHPSYDYFKFSRVDVNNAEQKKIFIDYFTKLEEDVDVVEGLRGRTIKYYK